MRQEGVHVIYPLSRGLSKTGQTVSYVSEDDGDLEDGWWLSRLNANNRNRFVEKEFVSGEVVILDLATGLMWPKAWDGRATNFGGAVTWSLALGYAGVLDYGGFDDWHVPNLIEYVSIVDFELSAPNIQSVFTGVDATKYHWTNSTVKYNTLWAYLIAYGLYFICTYGIKTGASRNWSVCRRY